MDEENWIKQAEADLKSAENSLLSKNYYASAFWSQQAIEKCLKAVIIKEYNGLMKTHDLIFLGKRAKLPENLLNNVKSFAGIYTETRYGVTTEEIPAIKFKEKDASNLLIISEEILKWSKKKI